MAVLYLDSSALVKRYAQETGTNWIINLTGYRAGNDLYTTRLTGPEIIAALFGKTRKGQISSADATLLSNSFRRDWQQQYRVVELDVEISDIAMDLAERYTLRAYDAVHVAAALDLQRARHAGGLPALIFVSADIEQLNAAQAEGLQTDNPDNHP